jgi:hypothetical protein
MNDSVNKLHKINNIHKTDRCKASSEFIAIFFFNLCCGTLGTAATNGLFYQPRMIGEGDCGEIGGMKIGRGNRSTRRKPAPVSLCPPQTPHACPDANPGRRGGKPATNRLSYGAANSLENISYYHFFLSSPVILSRPTSYRKVHWDQRYLFITYFNWKWVSVRWQSYCNKTHTQITQITQNNTKVKRNTAHKSTHTIHTLHKMNKLSLE